MPLEPKTETLRPAGHGHSDHHARICPPLHPKAGNVGTGKNGRMSLVKAIFKIEVIHSNMNSSEVMTVLYMCMSNCLCLLDNLCNIIVIVIFFSLIMNCGSGDLYR